MTLIRFLHNGAESYGSLAGDVITVLSGGIAEGFSETGETLPLDGVKLLAPVKPTKAICVGLNYMDHIKEMGHDIPDEPVIFLKPPTALIGPGDSVVRPGISKRVDYEGEFAVVIGRRARNVPESEAGDYILGYTCANDVTARDLQQKDGQWTRAKGFDTFMPLGPWIVTDLDPSALAIKTYLNGETVQSSNTDQLLFKVGRLVEFASSVMTLEPGDVILTGTSSGVGPMAAGDTVAVEIEGIGRLENTVV